VGDCRRDRIAGNRWGRGRKVCRLESPRSTRYAVWRVGPRIAEGTEKTCRAFLSQENPSLGSLCPSSATTRRVAK
jgi:hypothetical protein